LRHIMKKQSAIARKGGSEGKGLEYREHGAFNFWDLRDLKGEKGLVFGLKIKQEGGKKKGPGRGKWEKREQGGGKKGPNEWTNPPGGENYLGGAGISKRGRKKKRRDNRGTPG